MDELRVLGCSWSKSESLDWAHICLISSHQNDECGVSMASTSAGRVGAWIGKMPGIGAHDDSSDLMDRILEDDGRFLSGIEPPFAAVVFDQGRRRLRLISDLHGFHPLYYSLEKDTLTFCTKLAPLLRSRLIDWELDRQAVLDFFTYEHVTGCRTFADSVRLVPPGSLLTFEDGHLVIRSYVEERRQERMPSTLLEAADRLHETLQDSISESVRGKKRVAVTLSGGLDSRAILGCALDRGIEIKTYTFGNPGSSELKYAKEVARRAGVQNTAMEVKGDSFIQWFDHGLLVTGGMVNCIHYHILSLAQVLAKEAEVVLDGLGGDALTGAHLSWRMALTRSYSKAAKIVYKRRSTAWPEVSGRLRMFRAGFFEGLDYDPRMAVWQKFEGTRGEEPPWKGCHAFDIEERQRRFIQFGPHLLRPYIPVRTPFYGKDVLRLLSRLPLWLLMEQRAYLAMHRLKLRSLALVPESAYNLPLTFPLSVRFLKKASGYLQRRFIPWRASTSAATTLNYAGWFRTEVRGFLEERLLSDGSICDGIISREGSEELLREHGERTADHTIKLGCLLTFKSWWDAVKRQK